MKTLTAFIVFGLIACGQSTTRNTNAQVDTASAKRVSQADTAFSDTTLNIYQNYIPPLLKEFLNKELQGWTIPPPYKWDKYWFQQYKKDSSLVNFVSGDFNCDHKTDYALIIKESNETIASYAFLSSGNSFKKVKLEEYGNVSGQIEVGLEILKPGTYNYIDPNSDDDPPPIKIMCHAVQVVTFEKAAVTYFWDKGKLKSMQTGD